MDALLHKRLDFYETYLVEYHRAMGCVVTVLHPFVLFRNDEIDVPWYNYAGIVPWSDMPGRARICEVMAYYRAQGCTPFFRFTIETAPEGCAAALQAAGCMLACERRVMFQREPIGPPVPAGVRLGETGPHDLQAAGRILRISFGSDGPVSHEPELHGRLVARMRAARVRQLGAWLDGQLAAVVHMHTLGGVGRITGMATAPAFRGRGLAGLLTAYAARCARDDGAVFVALEVATPEAERVYARIGFSRAAERVGYSA